jgi:hypothetical protein
MSLVNGLIKTYFQEMCHQNKYHEVKMRIINNKSKRSLDSILLMLTPSEAFELLSKLKSINPDTGDHFHVSDLEFCREITVSIYTDKNLHLFSDEIRKIIQTN